MILNRNRFYRTHCYEVIDGHNVPSLILSYESGEKLYDIRKTPGQPLRYSVNGKPYEPGTHATADWVFTQILDWHARTL